jgi:hypothetical protein
MRPGMLWLAAVAALCAGAAGGAEVSDLPPLTGAGVERGVALLRCNTPSGMYRTSRATILDVGADARADVLITTAHGMPASTLDVLEDCKILARGREHDVVQAWSAGGSYPEHDWAVLLTRRIGGDVHRWRVAEVAPSWLDGLVADHSRVRLVLRYADAEQSDCHLEGWTAQRLLTHTCVTYPGVSGSPLVVGVDLEPLVIALHVGSELRWDGRKLDMASVARPIDAPVIAAIEAATLRATAARRRR